MQFTKKVWEMAGKGAFLKAISTQNFLFKKRFQYETGRVFKSCAFCGAGELFGSGAGSFKS
jgi:hypothetical protein